MSHGLIILCILAAFLLLSFVGWCLVRAGTLGEDDPTEDFLNALERQVQERGYVDQDGESTLTAYDRNAWKHATVKTHHAE